MKVFDCFLFYNEVEALAIRFHELADVVDHHVIVEGTMTFSGRPRQLGFDLNDPRWAPFRHKVIHVVVEDTPAHAGDWDREHFQRNAILRGLDRARPDGLGPYCDPQDLVLITDADEIPSAAAVRWVADHLVRGVATLVLSFYYYHLNQMICQPNQIGPDGGPVPKSWYFARAVRRAEIESPQAIRDTVVDACVHVVPNAGWHFSYLGGVNRIQTKIDAFSHQELNVPQHTDAANIADAIASGRDLYGRDIYDIRTVPIDASFPRFVVENQVALASVIREIDEPAAPVPSLGLASSDSAGKVALTIGIPTYNDFDGVYFTVQALRLYQDLTGTELLVIDTYGCDHTKDFVEGWAKARYVRATDAVGSAAKNRVFREATGESVLCLHSHVLLAPGAIRSLMAYYRAHPGCADLLQGPLLDDDLRSFSTHFDPVWRGQMWGVRATDPRAEDPEAEPFDIPMQGMGVFSCRKDAWPGFNPLFRGFGGEEGYIHEKVRQAGGRCLCLPWLRWLHRFGRPGGVPYPLSVEDKLRNYIVGHTELGLDLAPVLKHFREHLSEDKIVAVTVKILWDRSKEPATAVRSGVNPFLADGDALLAHSD